MGLELGFLYENFFFFFLLLFERERGGGLTTINFSTPVLVVENWARVLGRKILSLHEK